MRYTINKNSFVAYNSYNNDKRFIVAIGHCGALNDIQFIEIEYTDEGEIIHFYDSSNEELSEKFEAFKKASSVENCFDKYVEFFGNDKLRTLLELYKEQGCDYEHTLNCSCVACNTYKFTIYRGDSIERIIDELSKL